MGRWVTAPKHKAGCRPVSLGKVGIGHSHRVGRGLLKGPQDGMGLLYPSASASRSERRPVMKS